MISSTQDCIFKVWTKDSVVVLLKIPSAMCLQLALVTAIGTQAHQPPSEVYIEGPVPFLIQRPKGLCDPGNLFQEGSTVIFGSVTGIGIACAMYWRPPEEAASSPAMVPFKKTSTSSL
jgi:hypothetical protein